MDRLKGMEMFVQVVEEGSFTAAADRNAVSRAAVSKHISQLEDRLGARLLNRTTRRLSLTDIGRVYYERIKATLADIEEAESCASIASEKAAGLLRVNAPMSFGTRHLGPAIAAYCNHYPRVQIELELSDRFIDVVAEGFDVVIRIAALEDSTLIARRIAPCRRVVCASPDYLQRYGTPQVPQDLALHRCLFYNNLPVANGWVLSGPDGIETVRVSGPVRANNGDILRAAAVEGLGVALEPTFIVGPDIDAGRLNIVLPQYRPPDIDVYAVYPSRRHLSAKVRTFVEFLNRHFGEEPAWDRAVDVMR